MSRRPQPGDLNTGRPPRPAAPGSGGPGRRLEAAPGQPARSQGWELWNFRALFPGAVREDLEAVRSEQARILAREREALARLWSGGKDLLSPGRAHLTEHPELAAGITVSLHTGPYQLLPEPWLQADLSPLVMVNASALPRFREAALTLQRQLGHRESAQWAAVGEPGFMRQVVGAIRAGRPVLAYLDGNSGDDGALGTREHGMRYRLPGREIFVRTGLARLACRLACPLHCVSLRWDAGAVVWDGAPSLCPRPGEDHEEVTRRLFDWAFDVIRDRPAQWQYWTMLRDGSACFCSTRMDNPEVPPGTREELQREFADCCDRRDIHVRLVLESDVEVWGDVLADQTRDRFYPSAGLADADLDILRSGRPTLQELREHHGDAWLRFHGLRLVLLGLARLGA